MMLLAMDTSTRTVGIALYDGIQVLSESVWQSKDYHTVELAPAVEEMLLRARLSTADLQALAVATGPGSFTGLRIGMALAKGIALATHQPIIGIPTPDILAAAQPVRDLPLVVVLRAGRGRLAAAWYRRRAETWEPAGKVEVHTAESLGQKITQPTVVSGELTEAERRSLGRKRKNVILASPAQSVRRPAYLAELAWSRWQSGRTDDPGTLAPFYLHYNEPVP